MSGVRARIEIGFTGLGRAICRRPWLFVLVSVALIAVLAAGVARLGIDTSNEAFLHANDPTLTRYDAFKRQFGRDDLIIIAVETDTLFTEPTLAALKALHADLGANVPHLAAITSMVNARNTEGRGDTLHVDDLLAEWPTTATALAALERRVMANPLYRDRLISADGRLTTLVIELDAFAPATPTTMAALSGFDEPAPDRPALARLSDPDVHAAVSTVLDIAARHRRTGFDLHVAGAPPVTDAIKIALQADMRRFLGLAILIIGVALWLMFRTFSGVVLPLAGVLLALIATLGTMGHAGVDFKVPTAILPSFLLAVGVGASVHMLLIYHQGFQRFGDKPRTIAHALGHSGLAITMTGLTTAAGLGSFAGAEVAPIADLGIFSSLGVLISLALTLVLIPALAAIWPAPRGASAAAHAHPAFGRLIERASDLTTAHPARVLVFSLGLVAVFASGIPNLRFSHDVLAWLPEDWPVVQATRRIDAGLRGSVAVEVLIDAKRENGLYDPAILRTLDDLARALEEETRENTVFVGKASSLADILKEIHQALNRNDPAFHRVPDNARLIPQEFLLFENSGSDDLEDLVDTTFRTARFTIKVPWRDALEYAPFLRAIEERFAAALGNQAEITTTGVMTIFGRTLSAAIRSAAQSYVIALVVITLLMIALLGRLRIGLLSMIPNLSPILVTLGLMGWIGLPLDMFTMLIGSIAIGLAVDNTIHFMHNFRRHFERTDDVRASVAETLHTTGRAMVVSSIVLCLGFFIFVFASMENLVRFGWLTGLTIALALFADFLISPPLMALSHRRAQPTSPST